MRLDNYTRDCFEAIIDVFTNEFWCTKHDEWRTYTPLLVKGLIWGNFQLLGGSICLYTYPFLIVKCDPIINHYTWLHFAKNVQWDKITICFKKWTSIPFTWKRNSWLSSNSITLPMIVLRQSLTFPLGCFGELNETSDAHIRYY